MPLLSSALQTPATDFNVPGILDGKVTSMDVLDPAENNEKTLLHDVGDEFDVELCWELDGAATPVVGGYWIVSLYSEHIDGVGQMTGLLAGPTPIVITGGVTPLKFCYKFRVLPPAPKEGLYKLTAVINHSPTGEIGKITEMFGFAESAPIDIRNTTIESS